MGMAVNVPMLGLALPIGFVFALLVIPLKKAAAVPGTGRLLAASAVSVAGFLLSSSLQKTQAPESNIGQSISFAIFLLAFTRIIKNTDEAGSLLAWFSVGQICYFIIARPENTLSGIEEFWKYGVAYPVGTLVVYLLLKRATLTLLAALVIVGVVSIFLDYRSMGLVCLLAAVCCFVKGGPRKRRPLRITAGAAVLWVLAEVLPASMAAGLFGEEIQQRTLRQTVNDTPAFLGGRTESPLSIAAIMSKPLLGWGNSQTLDNETVSLGIRVADTLGMSDPKFFLPVWVRADGRVSLHSILLNAWVEGGLLGVVLPVCLFSLFVVALIRADGAMMPIVVFTSVHGIWDLLFSPWAGNQSVAFAITATLALWAVHEARSGPSGKPVGALSVDYS